MTKSLGRHDDNYIFEKEQWESIYTQYKHLLPVSGTTVYMLYLDDNTFLVL